MSVNSFANLVFFFYEKEKKLEIIRQILCEIADFEPYSFFKYLDKEQKNCLDSKDISEFLLENGECFSEQTITSTLLDHFSFLERKITYKNFLKMILPQENPILRKEVSQREIKNVFESDAHLEEIEYSLSKIMKEYHFNKFKIYIKREILTYTESNELKLQIGENKTYELTRSIDKNNTGFITFENLSSYFMNNELPLEEEIIIKFLKRVSKNDELKISRREFSSFLIPSLDKTPNCSTFVSTLNRTPLKSIENYDVYNRKSSLKEANPKTKAQENYYSNNTLRLETADFQYTEVQDDQKSFESIYESPIYKTHSFSKNMNLPSINLESQESLLELKNEFMNHHSLIIKDDHIEKIRRKYSFYAKESNENAMHNDKSELLYTFKKKKNDKCEELIEFFNKVISLQKKEEKMKQDVALRPDFNVLDFFVLFDKNQKGYLNFEEVETIFFELKIPASFVEICLFLKKYDQSGSGELKFSDFAGVFTPNQVEYAELLKQRKPINMDLEFSLEQMFSYETLKLICFLLREIIEDENCLENMRNSIMNKKSDCENFIKSIANNNDENFITLFNLKEMFETCKIYASDQEISILFNQLDCKKNGKISMPELMEEITPKIN